MLLLSLSMSVKAIPCHDTPPCQSVRTLGVRHSESVRKSLRHHFEVSKIFEASVLFTRRISLSLRSKATLSAICLPAFTRFLLYYHQFMRSWLYGFFLSGSWWCTSRYFFMAWYFSIHNSFLVSFRSFVCIATVVFISVKHASQHTAPMINKWCKYSENFYISVICTP